MSYLIGTDIWCDANLGECKTWTQGVEGSGVLIKEARKVAENRGWIQHNGMDICPTCWKEFKLKLPRGKAYTPRDKAASLEEITQICKQVLHDGEASRWVAGNFNVHVCKINAVIREYGDDFENGRDLTKPKGKG
jgi:hypothetical protein